MKHKKYLERYSKICRDTHRNQSTAQRRLTSCTGASMAVRTMSIMTREALGTLAEATEAAVEVSLDTGQGFKFETDSPCSSAVLLNMIHTQLAAFEGSCADNNTHTTVT